MISKVTGSGTSVDCKKGKVYLVFSAWRCTRAWRRILHNLALRGKRIYYHALKLISCHNFVFKSVSSNFTVNYLNGDSKVAACKNIVGPFQSCNNNWPTTIILCNPQQISDNTIHPYIIQILIYIDICRRKLIMDKHQIFY